LFSYLHMLLYSFRAEDFLHPQSGKSFRSND
jgi:hypothetical protein